MESKHRVMISSRRSTQWQRVYILLTGYPTYHPVPLTTLVPYVLVLVLRHEIYDSILMLYTHTIYTDIYTSGACKRPTIPFANKHVEGEHLSQLQIITLELGPFRSVQILAVENVAAHERSFRRYSNDARLHLLRQHPGFPAPFLAFRRRLIASHSLRARATRRALRV